MDSKVTPLSKLAKAILWRTAKDMKPEWGNQWLEAGAAKTLCKNGGIDHAEFVEAMKFIMGKSDVQRAILLQKLKKNIGV